MSSAKSTTGTAQESAQVTELAGDRLNLWRNHSRDETLEAVDGLRNFDSRILILLNVRLVQLVNEPRLGVDQVVDFLRGWVSSHSIGFIYTERMGWL